MVLRDGMIVGMVSTRFAGLDGVSLEAAKWARVLRAAGHEIAWFAGELGPEFAPGRAHPAAHFATAESRRLGAACFGTTELTAGVREHVERAAGELRAALEAFVARFGVEVLVPENVLAIPMQVPLGLAVTALLRDTGLPAVAHHHDFWWERDRFRTHAIADLLDAAFPPSLPGVDHVVISSTARDELLARRGIASTVIPNVMDFEHPPSPGDGAAFRAYCGVADGEPLVLQPTRVVPRKSIETTLALAARLGAVVVVGHGETDEASPFEGHRSYGDYLRAAALRLGVPLRFRPLHGGRGASLADAYAGADLVAYPSRVEGFGNALLEAFYHRRPVLVRRYPVYQADIAPAGVRCIEIDDDLTDVAVEEAAEWLRNPASWQDAVAANYDVGIRHFSYRVLRDDLLPLVGGPGRTA